MSNYYATRVFDRSIQQLKNSRNKLNTPFMGLCCRILQPLYHERGWGVIHPGLDRGLDLRLDRGKTSAIVERVLTSARSLMADG